ncbi:MAG TPA: aminopeptidase P family protein [Beijerinckiaceae bacterium]|nr:aminopeptidase P family protein [Beijerinckiaceae bacterium]
MFESRFQSFSDSSDPAKSAGRLAALRRELARQKLAGFIIPRADEHQNEYVPAGAERLAWLTGFTGSAGTAIVLVDRAALFVDGRYTIQAAEQVDSSLIVPVALADMSPDAWIRSNLKAGRRLGYDPWLHTPAQIESFERAAQAVGAQLAPVSENPLDAIWTERPAPPRAPIRLHPGRLAGEGSPSKLARIASALDSSDALLVSDPHAMAWAFNIRGADVAYTPLPLGWAIIPRAGRPSLYVAQEKLSASVRAQLASLAKLRDPALLSADVAKLGAHKKTVLFDRTTAPVALVGALKAAGGKAVIGADPIALMKACKNDVELEGSRAAHLRDGAAVTRFLAWFAERAPEGSLTEIEAAKALETFRRETGKLKDLSFPTISAFGPHAAIPHYRVTEASDRRIGHGLFLVDSGAQYEDGTTDITRTVAVGAPSAEMRDRFTRVLKGHIAIARAVFPIGVSGAQIDAFARRALWESGLDFDHGTGHGIGSYLSVHEGPQRISKVGATPLASGMILSNEPAYYKTERWGIRIENLIVVEPRHIKGAERPMLGFETITLAPIDLALVDASLMDAAEIAWLNAYHARVRKTLSQVVGPEVRRWLAQATRRLGE